MFSLQQLNLNPKDKLLFKPGISAHRERTVVTLTLALTTLALLAALFCSPGEVQALAPRLSEDDLYSGADKVISGEIIAAEGIWNRENTGIYTAVTVSVEETIKGDSGADQIDITVPGGKVDSIKQYVSDMPAFNTGEKAILYLTKIADPGPSMNGGDNGARNEQSGTYELYGGSRGKITIKEADPLPPETAGSKEFVWLGIRWPGEAPVVPYRVNATNAQTAEIRAAAKSWGTAGADFAFSYAGSHNRVGRAALNGVNEVLFYNLGTRRALAVATVWYSGRTIIEADITFNTLYSWSTGPFSSGLNDVQTIALHEFGHALGLGHSPNPSAIMYAFISGIKHDLHPADIAGVQYIYGTSDENTDDPEEENGEDPEEGENDDDPGNDDAEDNGGSEEDAPDESDPDEDTGDDKDNGDGEEEIADDQEYKITLLTRPANAGKTEGESTYEASSKVKITAIPHHGYHFHSWTENGSKISTSSTYTFTADRERTLTAQFQAEPLKYNRLAGENRYKTAIAVSEACFSGGSDKVIIARGDNYPDSLAGVPLAYALKAPILLTRPDGLCCATIEDILTLQAQKAIILGGEMAVSTAVKQELKDLGLEVERIWGEDRYGTAAEIAKRLAEVNGNTPDGAYLVLGCDFPDALAAAPYAAAGGKPVLLTRPDNLPEATAAAIRKLRPTNALVMGCRELITNRVRMDLLLLRVSIERVEGADRYTRMLNLADKELPPGRNSIFIATGENYPDALTGGVAAAMHNSGILLIPGNADSLPAEVKAFIKENRFKQYTIFGGPAAVSSGIETELAELLK